MKVLLVKDVYKLGRAGEVKRVADGYGRNFLLPQGLAVLATAGAMKQAENIKKQAAVHRAQLNQEMSGIAEKVEGVVLTFPARASETGKLYGSITNQMIGDALSKKLGMDIPRRQIDTQPLRALGEHIVHVRLTVDLVPDITVIVHREGEAVRIPGQEPAPQAETRAVEPVEADPAAVEEEVAVEDEIEEIEEVEEVEEVEEAEEVDEVEEVEEVEEA